MMVLRADNATRSCATISSIQNGASKACQWQSPQQTFALQTSLYLIMMAGGATFLASISIWLNRLGRRSGFTKAESSLYCTKGFFFFFIDLTQKFKLIYINNNNNMNFMLQSAM